MKYISYAFTFILVVFPFTSVKASAPAPTPRCGIIGVIQSARFEPAYTAECVQRSQVCATDAPLSLPARYSLDIKVEKSKYVSGDISLGNCDVVYPMESVQRFYINRSSLVTRTPQFTTGQQIEIPIVGINKLFDVYMIPGVKEAQKFSYAKNLKYGMKSDADVMDLQEQLNMYPSIYPEGLVTGNFGPATLRAVKRFQAKWNIPQTGFVGPLTRARLIQLMSSVNPTIN